MSRFIDWFFRDRSTGAIVIAQWPNLPLWLFAVASLLAWAIEAAAPAAPDWLGLGLRALAAVSLAWWGLDEAVRGVNPWRRCLGAAALLFLVWSIAARAA